MIAEAELAALSDRRVEEWALLRAANKLRDGASVLSEDNARSTDLYKQWMATCEENKVEEERIRRAHFPKAGHLLVTEREAHTMTPKLRRITLVWSR